MIDQLIVAARLGQFLGAVTLFGTPAFLLYGLGSGRRHLNLGWARMIVRTACLMVLTGALTSLFAQTASMAGDPAMAFDREALTNVLQSTAFGYGVSLRIGLSFVMLALAIVLPARSVLWIFSSVIGAIILTAFAWTGHGAAEDGAAGLLHAGNDVLHLIAAGVWLGALVALVGLTRSVGRSDPADAKLLHLSLERFSGVGSVVVAVLIATGLVNSWFLVGLSHVTTLLRSQYGVLLAIKLALFGLMFLLAAANRFQLTPHLGRAIPAPEPTATALRRLQRSVWLEAALGFGVIVLVSAMGMLAPPSAQG